MLDLEDAVPPTPRTRPGRWSPRPWSDHPAWVRVNAARTEWCEADPAAVAGRAFGIRIPQASRPTTSAVERAPGKPIICAVESARGVLAAAEIAAAPGVRFGHGRGGPPERPQRRQRQPDPVRPLPPGGRVPGGRPGAADRQRLPEARTTRPGCASRPSSPARSGSSASRPSILGSCPSSTRCSPSERELGWATGVVAAEAPEGRRSSCPAGFVDLPVAQRACRLLELATARA